MIKYGKKIRVGRFDQFCLLMEQCVAYNCESCHYHLKTNVKNDIQFKTNIFFFRFYCFNIFFIVIPKKVYHI